MEKGFDVNTCSNPDCKKGCNKIERMEVTENDICKDVMSVVDGLPVRCVGEWALIKNYHLLQYFSIFSVGMYKKWQINYIEICSGPGRCMDRDHGKEFDGTAMNIVNSQAFNKINKALFFDFNDDVVNILNARFKNLGIDKSKAKAIIGDYNESDKLCDTISKEIGKSSLNLIFIDPTDCSVPFLLIRRLSERIPNIDFIINVASGTDYNRNIRNALIKPNSFNSLRNKYSQFLGNDNFLSDPDNILMAEIGDNLRLRDKFRESYKGSLENLGFKYFRMERVRHYYDILFASKHSTGLEFWDKVHFADKDGQRKLF